MTDQATRQNAPQRDPIAEARHWYAEQLEARQGKTPHRMTMSTATLDLLQAEGNVRRALEPAPIFSGAIGNYAGALPIVTDDDMWLGAVQIEHADGSVQTLALHPVTPTQSTPPLSQIEPCPYPQNTLPAAAWEFRHACRVLGEQVAHALREAADAVATALRNRKASSSDN